MAVVKKKPLKKGSMQKARKKARNKIAKFNLELPIIPSEPSNDFRAYTWFLYGEKKIGKTSLLAMFKDIFFCMFETGGTGLRIMQRPVPTWEHFIGYVDLLLSKEGEHIKYVAIDTADFAWLACQTYVCKKHVIQHPSDLEWGKGYALVKEEWTFQMNRLLSGGKGVVYTSHYKELQISRRKGGNFSKTGATLQNSAREYLEGLIDIWTFYTYEKNGRVIYLKGDQDISAGHRLKERFRYTDGTEIKKLNVEGSPEQTFEKFMLAFNNKLKRKGGEAKKSLKFKK